MADALFQTDVASPGSRGRDEACNALRAPEAASSFEIIAGLVVLIAPQLGGAMVAPWLGGIVIDLLLVGHDEHAYWDIALRDFGLMLAAVALVALATHYHPTVRPAYAARTVAERASL